MSQTVITAQEIIGFRNMFGLSDEQFARYLDWSVTTLRSYEGGVPLTTAHARQLAKVMNIELDLGEPLYRSLDRYYSSDGPAHLRDDELSAEYRKISQNSGYGEFTREICLMRHSQLTKRHRP